MSTNRDTSWDVFWGMAAIFACVGMLIGLVIAANRTYIGTRVVLNSNARNFKIDQPAQISAEDELYFQYDADSGEKIYGTPTNPPAGINTDTWYAMDTEIKAGTWTYRAGNADLFLVSKGDGVMSVVTFYDAGTKAGILLLLTLIGLLVGVLLGSIVS